MILGYKPSLGGQEPYHYGKLEGADLKFIRVVAGAALPIFDRMLGAVIVVGEKYRASGPPSWVALAATTGAWSIVENAMAQYRVDLKFTYIVVEQEEGRRILYGMKGLDYGLREIPLISYAAPGYSVSEIGRSYVEQLWRKEERLVIPNYVREQMEMEPEMGKAALQCAMCWMKENLAYYAPLRTPQRGPGRVLGVRGLE